MQNQYLYHYGVKGMRWGVRKSYGERQVAKYTKKAKKYAYKAPGSEGKYPNGMNLDAQRSMNYSKLATYAEKARGKGTGVEREVAAYNLKANRTANKHLRNIEKISNKQLKVERDLGTGKLTEQEAIQRTTALMSKLQSKTLKATITQEKVKAGRDWIYEHPEIVNARYTGLVVGTVFGGPIGGVAGGAIGSSIGARQERKRTEAN